MITEDYCSYELSKLLKEKGFKQEGCHKSYSMEGPVAPTHQMAMKWLREYPRYIFIGIDNQYLFSYEVYHFHIRCNAPKREIDKVGKIDYRTYEEAVEAALRYSLENLI